MSRSYTKLIILYTVTFCLKEVNGHCGKSPVWTRNFDQDYSGNDLRRTFKKNMSIQWQLLSQSGCQHQDILRRAHQLPHQQATSPPPLSIYFLLYSLPMLCVVYLLFLFPSSLPPHPPLSTIPSVRRCDKRRVLSFPQCGAGCQCRRWTRSRQLCLCWALWFTVLGHSPRTGNLWKLPFWQASVQVSF